jgi:hypothetical protein
VPGSYTIVLGNTTRTIEMPTISGGHSRPLFYQGLCLGRISFDGIATVKNFVIE